MTHEIAALAHQAEVEQAGVACGVLNQIACTVGEPGLMLFLDPMTMERRLVPLPKGTELLVVNSGIPRAPRERSTISAAPYAKPPQRCSGCQTCGW